MLTDFQHPTSSPTPVALRTGTASVHRWWHAADRRRMIANFGRRVQLQRAWLIFGLVLTCACGQGEDKPKEPVWGKQPCEHCAMLLSEREHGAQVVTVDGDRLYFDDLGCLVAWTDAHPNATRRPWVRTADTHAWLPLDKALFAPAAHTPMDFGFIATAKPGSAPGQQVTWQQVTEAVRRKLHAQQE